MNSEKKRILIVDDSPANIKVLAEALRADYAISVATNGIEALRLVKTKKPSLILLDIIMPDMDGYEVCVKLKSDVGTKEIPVIFITAKSDPENETKGLELGAIDYITKPITPAVVRIRVKTHLALRQAYWEMAQQNQALLEAEKLRKDVDRITRHDLKSPLNGILGFSDLLSLDRTLSERQKEYVVHIKTSGHRLMEIINLSLNLYKIEQGTYTFDPNEVNLIPIIRHVLADSDRQIKKQNMTLDFLLDGCPVGTLDSFIIIGEDTLCFTLFSNLIKNAVEASPANKPLTVSLSNYGENTVTIHNFGGVPEEIQGRFFDKYSTFGKVEGSGLGTYSAKKMVEVQKGEIRMHSTERDGTVIMINFTRQK